MNRRTLADPSLVERYIRGGVMPRYMQRLREIDDELVGHRMRLEHLYADLRRSFEDDPRGFEQRWLRVAHSWRFDRVNELIAQHNEYYPIERRLPIDPRTGEYVTVSGRFYRREPAGPEWILARFAAAQAAV